MQMLLTRSTNKLATMCFIIPINACVVLLISYESLFDRSDRYHIQMRHSLYVDVLTSVLSALTYALQNILPTGLFLQIKMFFLYTRLDSKSPSKL